MKKCYILGAGFSKACDLPLASELTAQVFDHLHNDLVRKLNPQLIEDRRNFIRALYPGFDLETKWPDFEDLITLLNEWDDYRCVCGDDDTFVPHFKTGLIKHLAKLLCKHTNDSHSACKLGIIKRFLKKVHDEQGNIISFNWDLLLEIGAQELGIKINYQKQASNSEISVSKPHGSLNLAASQKDYLEKGAFNIHSLDTELEYDGGDKFILRAQNPTDALHRIVNPFENALIIEPTAKKSYLSPWINLQWHFALDMVRTAEEITIIGYSLPHTDIRPRILLSLIRFKRDKYIPIKLIDPKGESLRERFENVVGAPLEIVSKSWEDIKLGTAPQPPISP